jgi:hypothetical protein
MAGRRRDPWGEALKLERALVGRVPTRLLLTGLFSHTGAERTSPRLLARGDDSAIARALASADIARAPG